MESTYTVMFTLIGFSSSVKKVQIESGMIATTQLSAPA